MRVPLDWQNAAGEQGDHMTGWNFADVYEGIAARVPDRPCQVQGDRVITWAEFERPSVWRIRSLHT